MTAEQLAAYMRHIGIYMSDISDALASAIESDDGRFHFATGAYIACPAPYGKKMSPREFIASLG